MGTVIPTTTTHMRLGVLVLWWDSLRSHKWQGKGLKSEWTGIITNLAFPLCRYSWWIFVRKWTCHWNSCFGDSSLKWWPSPSAQMRGTFPVPSLQRMFCLPKSCFMSNLLFHLGQLPTIPSLQLISSRSFTSVKILFWTWRWIKTLSWDLRRACSFSLWGNYNLFLVSTNLFSFLQVKFK